MSPYTSILALVFGKHLSLYVVIHIRLPVLNPNHEALCTSFSILPYHVSLYVNCIFLLWFVVLVGGKTRLRQSSLGKACERLSAPSE